MMNFTDMSQWEIKFRAFILAQEEGDSAHGLAHINRVLANAKRLGALEGAEEAVVIPSAWLHDCVAVEKDSPQRKLASTLSANKAKAFLTEIDYPMQWIEPIAHAIQAHSFSANIAPETLEAKVVQDADRLDALGAVGLARCLMVGERLGRPLYDPLDPFCEAREADDGRFTIDHFYTKLFKLPALMQTDAGRQEAQRRADYLQAFLDQLRSEIS